MLKKIIHLIVFGASVIVGLQGSLSANAECKGKAITRAADHSCCPGFQKKIVLRESAALHCMHCLDRGGFPTERVKAAAALAAPAAVAATMLPAAGYEWRRVLQYQLAAIIFYPPDAQIVISLRRILI